jgi:hypothetical protein
MTAIVLGAAIEEGTFWLDRNATLRRRRLGLRGNQDKPWEALKERFLVTAEQWEKLALEA